MAPPTILPPAPLRSVAIDIVTITHRTCVFLLFFDETHSLLLYFQVGGWDGDRQPSPRQRPRIWHARIEDGDGQNCGMWEECVEVCVHVFCFYDFVSVAVDRRGMVASLVSFYNPPS